MAPAPGVALSSDDDVAAGAEPAALRARARGGTRSRARACRHRSRRRVMRRADPCRSSGACHRIASAAIPCHTWPHRSMPPAPRQAARRVAAVSRALAVMDALAAGGELGTNEIARRTGVNASTVSRLLATLASAGYVDQAANGRYRLGIRLVQLGNAVVDRLDLRELAGPSSSGSSSGVGETATLSVAGGYEAVTVDFVQSPSSVQGVAQLGRPSVAARHGDRQGAARVRGHRASAAARFVATRRARSPTRARSLGRSSASARAAGRTRSGSARRTSRRSPRPCAEAAASSRRSSASRGRRARLDAKAPGSCPRAAARCAVGPVASASAGSRANEPVGRRTRRGSRHRARSAASPCGACARGSATDPGRGRAGPGARSATSSRSASTGRGDRSRSRSTSTPSEWASSAGARSDSSTSGGTIVS